MFSMKINWVCFIYNVDNPTAIHLYQKFGR